MLFLEVLYNVEANLNAYTDTGVFSIYFGCDTHDTDRCISLVDKELQRLREKPLSDIRLRAAKKQIIGQIGVAVDNTENIALDMGKTFLHYGRYDSQAEVFQRINGITSRQLWEVSNELLTPDNLSTLIYR